MAKDTDAAQTHYCKSFVTEVAWPCMRLITAVNRECMHTCMQQCRPSIFMCFQSSTFFTLVCLSSLSFEPVTRPQQYQLRFTILFQFFLFFFYKTNCNSTKLVQGLSKVSLLSHLS